VGRIGRRSYRKLGELWRRAYDRPSREHHPDAAVPPWTTLRADSGPSAGALCNICRWQGGSFEGGEHIESMRCPACGSNGRDRFLHWCLAQRVDLNAALRVIECSPRLGSAYRKAMATWFFYRTADYDQRAHAGHLRLDLQAIDFPDGGVDVMLCAHVLEHVLHTDRALAELHRVLAPGGHLLLQVPVLQGRTAPPKEPEFHGDDTPVHWRFGFDLTDRLRSHGFATDVLCTGSLARAVKADENPWTEWSGEFDLPDMLNHAIADDLVVVADETTARRLGFQPGYMYLTWDCRVRP
jgi:SAM-dependent methyltransferase